ncbi:MAG: hypothetical protein ABIG95_01540 [Candidatus Woesearchaeota archaeon]
MSDFGRKFLRAIGVEYQPSEQEIKLAEEMGRATEEKIAADMARDVEEEMAENIMQYNNDMRAFGVMQEQVPNQVKEKLMVSLVQAVYGLSALPNSDVLSPKVVETLADYQASGEYPQLYTEGMAARDMLWRTIAEMTRNITYREVHQIGVAKDVLVSAGASGLPSSEAVKAGFAGYRKEVVKELGRQEKDVKDQVGALYRIEHNRINDKDDAVALVQRAFRDNVFADVQIGGLYTLARELSKVLGACKVIRPGEAGFQPIKQNLDYAVEEAQQAMDTGYALQQTLGISRPEYGEPMTIDEFAANPCMPYSVLEMNAVGGALYWRQSATK